MFWIPALELRFELRIGLAPENRQVLGNLYRTVAWRKHLNADGNAAAGNPESVFDAVQVLNARRDRRRGVSGINDFHVAAAGQRNSLRRIFFNPSLLLSR